MEISSARVSPVTNSSPASLNSMQLAIISLKDKCQKQQKRLEELEGEKIILEISKENIYSEIKKLHESNVKLRDKNLQLSHDLQVKSIECTELRRTLEDKQFNETQSAKQIERLQNQMEIASHRELSSHSVSLVSISEEARESFHDDQESSISEARESLSSREFLVPVSHQDTKSLVDQVSTNYKTIKDQLYKEQKKLRLALNVLQQNKLNSDQKIETLISATLSTARSKAGEQNSRGRKCPMCEVEFTMETTQDEFECHVVEHFNYEESETLRHFDTVPDAFWSCNNSLEHQNSS
ncbi:uncharacterized protein LOC111699458 [Eurytemora carolleeae]|uniref:uncharacterized protein LOC111699458 n=1 Tax=Eurytemora carolleeae TaxID=1294199 RepID=UPI000C76CD06|nr:uncharacterized protein LOC111699458 [Eurytemora carolleeae]|eukprot:XP_023325910.1 uncharacterized protein LOC111699458 [Eurytemora affinis]